jgi:tetratricopeptide (TPR) repeat protein
VALEAALYELTGAGLVACAAGLGLAVPRGAVRSGDAFIGFLSQRGAWSEVNRLVQELKRDVIEAAAHASIPADSLAAQAAEAVALLEQVRPRADLLQAALSREGAAPADQFVTQILDALTSQAHEATAGANPHVLLMLRRLFARLLREPHLITALGPALQEYLAITLPPHAAAGPASASKTGDVLHQPVMPPRSSPPATPLADVALVPSPEIRGSEFHSIKVSAAHGNSRARVPAPAVVQLMALHSLGEPFAVGLVGAGVVEALDQIGLTRSLTPGVFSRFLRTLEAQACPPATAPLRLSEMAVWLEGLVATLTKPSNEDAETRRLKSEAAQALQRGDWETAVQMLKNARRTVREGRRRIEERLREDILQLNQQMSSEAGIIARQAEMELTRRDYAAAAELFAEARDSLPGGEIQSAWLFAMRQGEALFRLGDEFDDAAALEQSVLVHASCLGMTSRDEAPRNWAAAQCGMALAHLRLAERAGDETALRSSIEAWRAALGVLGSLDEPGQTLVSQQHLARALVVLGESANDTAAIATALGEALDVYRAIGAAISRDRLPLDWAHAQMNIASTLLTLDERADSGSTDAALTEAMTALDGALTIYSRSQHPVEWSTARMNKGNVYLALGDREQSLPRYGDAVACFEDALGVQSRETSPGSWALVQTNLANALAAIGEKARDPLCLDAAAQAYRQALAVLTGPGDAMRRAIAELNLGTVLVRLAEHHEPQRHRSEAMSVMVCALETFKARNATAFASIAEVNLRNLHKATAGSAQPVAAAPHAQAS